MIDPPRMGDDFFKGVLFALFIMFLSILVLWLVWH